jgi:hypothetical protein
MGPCGFAWASQVDDNALASLRAYHDLSRYIHDEVRATTRELHAA